MDDSIPIVTIDRHFSAQIPCVSSDNYRGGEMAAEKLIELGCKNLLFFRIGPNIYGEVEKRGPGFENACQMAKVAHESLILSDDDTEQPFYRFLEEHIQDGKLRFDGIFCNSDGLAVRVCEFLRNHGIRIPEDVQIVGYDGVVNYATGRFECSTIVQPVTEMAETAVKLLLDQEGTIPPANIALPVSYAPGGTTRD